MLLREIVLQQFYTNYILTRSWPSISWSATKACIFSLKPGTRRTDLASGSLALGRTRIGSQATWYSKRVRFLVLSLVEADYLLFFCDKTINFAGWHFYSFAQVPRRFFASYLNCAQPDMLQIITMRHKQARTGTFSGGGIYDFKKSFSGTRAKCQ